MNTKTAIWIGMGIGSTLGSCVPLLWGSGFLSLWSVIFSAVGGLAGIYFGYKIGYGFE